MFTAFNGKSAHWGVEWEDVQIPLTIEHQVTPEVGGGRGREEGGGGRGRAPHRVFHCAIPVDLQTNVTRHETLL